MDCFPPTPWWVYAIMVALVVVPLLFAWGALRPAQPPSWSLTGKTRGDR